jgi:hypothetical protein
MPAHDGLSGLSPDVLAGVLTKAFGTEIHPDMIAADISKGAPVNSDGTIGLVAYVAWLIKHEKHV